MRLPRISPRGCRPNCWSAGRTSSSRSRYSWPPTRRSAWPARNSSRNSPSAPPPVWGGDAINNLFDWSGRTIYGLGSLTQPIFAGGKLRGQLQLAEATKEEMVLNYQKTIIGAFRDVSNALIALNKQRATREQQEKLVASAEDATRLARMRYQGGATSYLEVLTTDSTLFSAQLNLVAAQQGEALTLVQLYSALGGGWQ